MADMKKEQERDELHRAIWAIADELRGAVDGWDFKNYVLGTMFYRYISENMTAYINAGEIEAGNTSFDYAKIKDAEELRKELKVREDIAVMNPTEKNIKNYLDAWHLVMDKSTVFTDQWRRVVWGNPQYDYSLKSPSNNSALRVNNQIKDENRGNYLREIAKEHGLIFFFRSDCPYCHQYAPTLKMLSEMYGIEVLAVSIDGGGLPDFPNYRDGRAVAQQWGIEKVPATFIASKKTNERAPVGFGVMSLQEIIERIWVLTNTTPGQEF